jgi:predicted DCC family thiol-disulfide oxidoreductase YuxK
MQKLYVLYDSRCELCQRLKNWLLVQRQWIPLALVPAGSAKAQQLFPDLPQIATAEDLVVISDNGEVYLNNHAWIMALYALVEYRAWAYRLSHPLLLPLARQAFDTLSKNRHTLSRLLNVATPENIAAELRTVSLEPCAAPQVTIHDYLK